REVPKASDTELWLFFLASLSGLLSIFAMIFVGLVGGSVFAETFLDNVLLLAVSLALILLGGLLLLLGAGLAFLTVRRARRSTSASKPRSRPPEPAPCLAADVGETGFEPATP